jgi:hypothetical protein
LRLFLRYSPAGFPHGFRRRCKLLAGVGQELLCQSDALLRLRVEIQRRGLWVGLGGLLSLERGDLGPQEKALRYKLLGAGVFKFLFCTPERFDPTIRARQ